MVEREAEHLVPLFAAGETRCRRASAASRSGRRIRCGSALASTQEVLEFGRCRHGWGAAVARHDQRAARVRGARAGFERLIAQPAGQEARRERVARAEHVQHFDFHAAVNRRIVERSRDLAVDDLAAQRPALEHQRGRRDRAHHRERFDQFGFAAGDAKFLFGADHQIEQRQDALQMRGDALARDKAGFAVRLARESPQHRAVVDIEHRAHLIAARVLERAAARAVHLFGGEVRAGNQQRLRRRDERFVEIRFVDGHVGAVFAVEDQREGVAVFQAEQHQRGQALLIDPHMADVATLFFERFGEEAAHVVVADAREHCRREPEPRAAERDIRRRTAEILREARHVFEPRADLLRVQIDGEAAEAHDVAAAARREPGGGGPAGCAGVIHEYP